MMIPRHFGAMIGVDGEYLEVLLLGGLEHAEVAAGGCRVDEVHPGGIHRDSLLLGAHRIGKRTVAADPADIDLHVRVDRLDPLRKAVRVTVQEGNIERADHTDLLRLRQHAGGNPHQVAGLVFAEDGAMDVRGTVVDALVDDQEIDIRGSLCSFLDDVVEFEAEHDDDVGALADRSVDVFEPLGRSLWIRTS